MYWLQDLHAFLEKLSAFAEDLRISFEDKRIGGGGHGETIADFTDASMLRRGDGIAF